MFDELAPLSPLDVVEALLRREPGFGRVVARLRRLKDECDVRVEGSSAGPADQIREAFDQIGGMVEIALERLENRERETEESR